MPTTTTSTPAADPDDVAVQNRAVVPVNRLGAANPFVASFGTLTVR
jgi:hypothetical protein